MKSNKLYYINILFYNFLDFDLRKKLNFDQYFSFKRLVSNRWKNKFKKVFLVSAVDNFIRNLECSELITLRDDFKGCYECFCKEFCK